MSLYPRECVKCHHIYKSKATYYAHRKQNICDRNLYKDTTKTEIIPIVITKEEEEEEEEDDMKQEEAQEEEEDNENDIKIEESPNYEVTLTQQQFIDGTLSLPLTIHGSIENPLFKATEIGAILEVSIHNSLRNVDEDEIMYCMTLGGTQEAIFLTEEGMYQVVMMSRKPVAKKLHKFAARLIKQKRLELQIEMNATRLKAVMFEKALKAKQNEVDQLKKTKEINARKQARQQSRNELRNAATENIYLYTDNRGYHKIGKTKEDVKKRTDAQRTSLPELAIRAEYKCISCKEIEQVLHLIFHEHRIDKNREFFDIDFEAADKIIRNVILFIDGYRKLNKDNKVSDVSKFVDEGRTLTVSS